MARKRSALIARAVALIGERPHLRVKFPDAEQRRLFPELVPRDVPDDPVPFDPVRWHVERAILSIAETPDWQTASEVAWNTQAAAPLVTDLPARMREHLGPFFDEGAETAPNRGGRDQRARLRKQVALRSARYLLERFRPRQAPRTPAEERQHEQLCRDLASLLYAAATGEFNSFRYVRDC